MRIEGDYDEVHWYGEVRVDGRPLDPGPSLKVRNHSPDGFAWGYAGSGPAQLALAVLLAAGVPEPQAAEHYQEFKREFVERLDRSRFALDVDLDDWLRRKGAGRSRLLAQAVLDPSRVQRPVDTSSLSAWAEGILARLADVAVQGLPDAYDPPEEYWYDFWPDLPWDGRGSDVLRLILGHGEFPLVAQAFTAKTGLDLAGVLAEASLQR